MRAQHERPQAVPPDRSSSRRQARERLRPGRRTWAAPRTRTQAPVAPTSQYPQGIQRHRRLSHRKPQLPPCTGVGAHLARGRATGPRPTPVHSKTTPRNAFPPPESRLPPTCLVPNGLPVRSGPRRGAPVHPHGTPSCGKRRRCRPPGCRRAVVRDLFYAFTAPTCRASRRIGLLPRSCTGLGIAAGGPVARPARQGIRLTFPTRCVTLANVSAGFGDTCLSPMVRSAGTGMGTRPWTTWRGCFHPKRQTQPMGA